jgi:hypothetical protein
VTCIPTARQRLGKHIPTRANVRDNRTSIARKQRVKHASSTIRAVFSVVSNPRGFKRTQKTRPSREQQSDSVEFRELSLPGYVVGTELSRVFGIGSCRIMARKELICEDSMCDLK